MTVFKDKVELRADFPLAKSSCSRMARPLPGLLGEAQLRKYAHLTLMDRASLKLSAGKHTITLTLADYRDRKRFSGQDGEVELERAWRRNWPRTKSFRESLFGDLSHRPLIGIYVASSYLSPYLAR